MPQYDELGAVLGNNRAPVLGLGVNPATQAIDEPTVDENLIRQQRIDRGDFARARGRSFSQTTPEEFEGAVRAANAEAEPKPALGSDVIAGAKSGVLGMRSIYQGGKALLGDFLNDEEMQSNAAKEYQRLNKEAGKLAEGRTTTLEDIDNFSEGVDYVQFQLGNVIPSVAESIGVSALGALAGGATSGPVGGGLGAAAGLFGKKAVKDYLGKKTASFMAKKMSKEAAEAAAEKSLRKRAGAGIALWASGGAMGAGDIYAETMDEQGHGSKAAALIGAIPYAALDAVTEIGILGKIGMGTVGESALKRYSTAMLAGAGKEGFAESGQEGVKMLAAMSAGKEYTADEVLSALGNSFVAGGIGGGMMGAPGGIAGVPASPEMQEAQKIANAAKMHESTRIGKGDKDNPFKSDYTKVPNLVGAMREQEAQKNLPADQRKEVGEVLFTDASVAKSAHNMNKYAGHFGTGGLGNKLVEDNFRQLLNKYVFNDSADATARQEATDAVDGFLSTLDDPDNRSAYTAASFREEYEARIAAEEQKKVSAAKTRAEVAERKLADAAKVKETGKPASTKKGEPAQEPAEEPKTPEDVKREIGDEIITAAKEKQAVKAAIKRETKAEDVVVDQPSPKEAVQNEVVDQTENLATSNGDRPAREPARDEEIQGVSTPGTTMENAPTEDQGTAPAPAREDLQTATELVQEQTDTNVAPEWLSHNIQTTVDNLPAGLADKIESAAVQEKTATQTARELGIDKGIVREVRASLGIPSMDEVTDFDNWRASKLATPAPVTPVELVQEQTDTNVVPEVQETAQEPPDTSPVRLRRFGTAKGDGGYSQARYAKSGVAKQFPGIDQSKVTQVKDEETGKWYNEIEDGYPLPERTVKGKKKSKRVAGEKKVALNEAFTPIDAKTGKAPNFIDGVVHNGTPLMNKFRVSPTGLQVQDTQGEWIDSTEVWGDRDLTKLGSIIDAAPEAREGQDSITLASQTHDEMAKSESKAETARAKEGQKIARAEKSKEAAAQIAPITGEVTTTSSEKAVSEDQAAGDTPISGKEEFIHLADRAAGMVDDLIGFDNAMRKLKKHTQTWLKMKKPPTEAQLQIIYTKLQGIPGNVDTDNTVVTSQPSVVPEENISDRPEDEPSYESLKNIPDELDPEVIEETPPLRPSPTQERVVGSTAISDAHFIAQLNEGIRVDRDGFSVDSDEVEYATAHPLVVMAESGAQVYWNGAYTPVSQVAMATREHLLNEHTELGKNFKEPTEDEITPADGEIDVMESPRSTTDVERKEAKAAIMLRAKRLAAQIRKNNPNGVKVVVLADGTELAKHRPEVTGPLIKKHPTLGGYFDPKRNEAVIVVGRAATSEEVERIIIHEVVGHGGMRALFGKKWQNFINKAIDTNPKAVLDSFKNTPPTYGHSTVDMTGAEVASYKRNKKSLGYDWVVLENAEKGVYKKLSRKDAQMLLNEHIARQAERFVTNPELLDSLSPGARNWFHRVMAYVRHVLRPYVKFKVSDADILSLLAESYDRSIVGNSRQDYMEQKYGQIRKDVAAGKSNLLNQDREKNESNDKWKSEWESASDTQLREDGWDGVWVSDAAQSADENVAATTGVSTSSGHNHVNVSVVTDAMTADESQIQWLNKARKGADSMLRSLSHVPYVGKLTHNAVMPGQRKFGMLNRIHKGRVDSNARRATTLHKMLGKLPSDQLNAISEAWTSGNQFSSVDGLNAHQEALLTQGRKDLEDIQRMLNTMTYKGHKILSDKQLEDTEGRFLHTEYMRYLAAYRGSGKMPSGFDWMKKRTATKATQAQLEKISNASYTIPSTLGLVGRDTHLLRFMEDVVENAENKEGPAWVVDSRATFKVGLAGGDQRMTINQIRNEIDLTVDALNQERMAHVGTDTEAKAILESNLVELERVYEANEEARLDNVANAMYQSGGKYADVTPSGNVVDKKITDISRQEKELFLENNFVWVTSKSHPNLLPFQGKYVHKEIVKEFTNMDNSFEAEGVQKNAFAKAVGDATASGGILDKTTRAWKLSKTGLNIPAYYMRNFIGNMFLLDISTSTNAATLSANVIKESFDTLKGTGKMYGDHTLKEWADKFGLYSTTYGASELYLLADDFESQMKKDAAKENNQLLKMAGYHVKDSMMWLADKTANMHGLMEGIFKQVVMKDYIDRFEKTKGVNFNSLSATQQMGLMAAATEEAGNAIFDYDKVPSWARTLRRTPFGTPFMTFNYKMAGALPRAMMKHPWKLARYYAAPGLVSAALMASGMADFDDEEMDEVAKQIPWYMRNKSGIIIMPTKDANGKVQYFDLTYIFPPTLFTDAYMKMMNPQPGSNPVGAFKDIVFGDLGLLGGPIPQAITAGLSNTDPFTGRDIWVDGDLPVNNWERTATWMYNLAMPPVLTEGGALGRSFNQAGIDLPMISSGQEFTKYGTDKETGAQTFFRGMGLSGGGFSPMEAMASNEKRYKYKLSQIQKARAKAAVDPNKSRMERIKAVRAYEAQILELNRHRVGELNGR